MYQVNRSENSIVKLEAKRFSEENLQERKHLQEWLATTPEALGEELLIIQKEFDGFEGTSERLDLLALDKEGQLVIIENKLDDSGRDVVWQAVKYAAYCSSLNKTQIVQIYQKYLDSWGGGDEASRRICEFLDVDELDEVVLNAGNDQRVMLVAANFRKEVTATVLWLLAHQIRAQCFRVVLYSRNKDLFVDVKQIIPTPEAQDFMIGMATKESEEKSTQGVQRRSEKLRLAFWDHALEALRARGLERYNSISASKDQWLNSGTGVSGCVYTLIFARKEARVEVVLARSDAAENKWLFDRLIEQKSQLENCFGNSLEWKRLDEKKSSKISFSQPFDGFNQDTWPGMIEWLGDNISRLDQTFSEPLNQLNQQLKSNGLS